MKYKTDRSRQPRSRKEALIEQFFSLGRMGGAQSLIAQRLSNIDEKKIGRTDSNYRRPIKSFEFNVPSSTEVEHVQVDNVEVQDEPELEDEPREEEEIFEPMPSTRRDPKRTEMMQLPTEGIIRSCRGTIEMVIQKNGRTFTPSYNAVGILTAVRTNQGFSFMLAPDKKTWLVINAEGRKLNTTALKSVYFDKKGNLIYETICGDHTIMNVDGTNSAIA